MQVKTDGRKFYEIECDALVVGVYEGDAVHSGVLGEIDRRSGGVVSSLVETGEFIGKSGETAWIHSPGDLRARRLLLAGAGKQADFTQDSVRRMAGAAARLLRGKKVRSFAFMSPIAGGDSAQAAVEGALLALFEPDKYHTNDRTESRLEEMTLVADSGDIENVERAISRGRIIAESANFARDIINEPSNILTPSELARRAGEIAEQYGLALDVLDEARMKDLGMGSLLGVAQGSNEPPRLIVLRYTAPIASGETVAIVGKGVTFDTGGISIKPAEGMEKMKYDMAGGATTLAALRAVAQLRPSVNVIGIVPAVENMPGGRAQRPGDVVRSMAGKTIEVINTDAEGRLILADALTYARQQGATRIVDLATLTGAVSIALGDVYVAVMGNDQAWVDAVIAAGRRAGEKIWQLPLDREYREQIKSEIADIKNVGGRKAGTITAGYFLREFVEDTPWAHLDIAGTAWNDSTKPHLSVGPTAVCVRTLVQLVEGAG
ncbi:MAG: leucyl aminopeptidase [Acidobacteria bacterium]|nr:leucyl aminopeptidase [Acidobacteriota bacterium]MCW5969818.1 leucyl aminopeptidase [Blastocatellales bacterium]